VRNDSSRLEEEHILKCMIRMYTSLTIKRS
jgi:hypothetical protein